MTDAADSNSSVECENLVAQIRLGSQVAFQRLYELTSPKVYGYLLKMVKSRSLADDIMQEAYVKIWLAASKYDANRGTVIAWIYTLARYQALDALQKQQKQSDRDTHLDQLGETSEELETQFSSVFDEADIYQCMQQLAASQRTGIFAAFYHGWTYNELAERLTLPLGTIKSRVRRGLALLRECLEQ